MFLLFYVCYTKLLKPKNKVKTIYSNFIIKTDNKNMFPHQSRLALYFLFGCCFSFSFICTSNKKVKQNWIFLDTHKSLYIHLESDSNKRDVSDRCEDDSYLKKKEIEKRDILDKC